MTSAFLKSWLQLWITSAPSAAQIRRSETATEVNQCLSDNSHTFIQTQDSRQWCLLQDCPLILDSLSSFQSCQVLKKKTLWLVGFLKQLMNIYVSCYHVCVLEHDTSSSCSPTLTYTLTEDCCQVLCLHVLTYRMLHVCVSVFEGADVTLAHSRCILNPALRS